MASVWTFVDAFHTVEVIHRIWSDTEGYNREAKRIAGFAKQSI